MGRDNKTLLRKFHQARWDEQIIFELSVPGERGILVPKAEQEISAEVGDGISVLGKLRRKQPAALPEVNQMKVNRHFMRLSQETMGTDVNIDISQGTCTMKSVPSFRNTWLPGIQA
jgi:glycine dehydrogenase subunit 2